MSQSQFYTHQNVSLEKNVDTSIKPVRTNLEDLDRIYEINRCVDWIKSNNFQKVCLQFPDHLLTDSSEVAFKLQTILNKTIYILGDTAYESCCIDYVAAAHIYADAIVHFGPICFSKTSSNIPSLNIYEKHELDVEKLRINFHNLFEEDHCQFSVLVDSGYIHHFDDIKAALKPYQHVVVQRIDEDPLIIENKWILFIGTNKRKMTNVQFTYQPEYMYFFGDTILMFEAEETRQKRSYYLREKIRDSKTIGIVIGTLCVQNYLEIIERLKDLIKSRGKKYYLISVGKPTVAKLANFQEVEIYVIISCSMSEIYLSRDFYRPIVTPFDVEAALNPNHDMLKMLSYDYNSILNDQQPISTDCKNNEEVETDVSLLTNRIRTLQAEEKIDCNIDNSETQIALKHDGTVMLTESHGAGFLAQRSWRGLEQDVEFKEPELAQEGKFGTATKYEHEPL